MVDSVKRNERRRNFYESIRKDPEEFMQIHGRKCPIHVDPVLARNANSANTLRKWQGDPNILIDRFDVRAHLDYIPEAKVLDKEMPIESVEELQCEYERYRILGVNEFQKVTEKSFLSSIAAKEFWPSSGNTSIKAELEKKKKSAEKKAAIGFSYDSETATNSKYLPDSDSDSEDELDEAEDFDLNIDLDGMNAEQVAGLNKIGQKYRIVGGSYINLLKMDRKEQLETAEIKEIDRAKLALSVKFMHKLL
uniref:Suppressor of white apricot N-terminal domain-containing protein n=1 Tax=Acrobeloides nanus TaxID=290746 RepID=A0A914EA32_9BILA